VSVLVFLKLDVSPGSGSRIDSDIISPTVGPTIPLYLSFFYTKHEMGLRMAYWFGFAAVAGAFGGLIAFGVQQAHSHVANWKILFIIEVSLISLLSPAFGPMNR
jgi:MFS family permease